jgi:hypothetical protein
MSAGDEEEALRGEIRRLRIALDRATLDISGLVGLRGLRILRHDSGDDLLLPRGEYLDRFFGLLGRYSYRLFLRDAIKHPGGFGPRDLAIYASLAATEDYVAGGVAMGIIVEENGGLYRLARRLRSFGPTLEWYVAEVFRREFASEAMAGVAMKGGRAPGDYDLLARPDGRLLYVEVKSSPPKQVEAGAVRAYLERVDELRPDIAVFFMDTELRMKDKIVPMFEDALGGLGARAARIDRVHEEIFRWGERMFIMNAKGGVVANFGRVLSYVVRGRSPVEGYPSGSGEVSW